jgi:hypothetical protein
MDTPAERHRHRRRWLPSGVVVVAAREGCRKTHPAYGPRQRRPVHPPIPWQVLPTREILVPCPIRYHGLDCQQFRPDNPLELFAPMVHHGSYPRVTHPLVAAAAGLPMTPIRKLHPISR